MHRWYDPRLFDVLSDAELLVRFAPKDACGQGQDALTGAKLREAGFDVRWTGPPDVPECAYGEAPPGVALPSAEGCERVDEELFSAWLDFGSMECCSLRLGFCVARWWAGLELSTEENRTPLKLADEETCVSLFRRLREGVCARASDAAPDGQDHVSVADMVGWLREHMGESFQLPDMSEESELVDEVLLELHVVSDRTAAVVSNGCMEELGEAEDPEEAALRLGERLAYGWPAVESEPQGFRASGRFAKSFPLAFPLGIGDPFDVRPRDVPFAECVQHLLRLRSGIAVRGNHGHRLVWALTNVMLLLEASGKDIAGHRVAMRRLLGRSSAMRCSLAGSCVISCSPRRPCGPWCISL